MKKIKIKLHTKTQLLVPKIRNTIKNKKSVISKENEMEKSQAFLVMKKHPRMKNVKMCN